jgi:hypothetical protein
MTKSRKDPRRILVNLVMGIVMIAGLALGVYADTTNPPPCQIQCNGTVIWVDQNGNQHTCTMSGMSCQPGSQCNCTCQYSC